MKETPFRANRLLAALPGEVHERLRPAIRTVALESGDILYSPREKLRYVYFPLDAVVSKIYLSSDGKTTALGVVGREGLVGISAFLAGLETTTEARVIMPGAALRLRARALGAEFERGGPFQEALLAFTQAFVAQTGQIAVCNRHHSVEQQLCFWLLLYLERASSNELRITQELLAELLGVRREGVTRAALKLKAAGILDYKHGTLKVLDRERLKSLSCECYYIIHRVYDTMLPAEIRESAA